MNNLNEEDLKDKHKGGWRALFRIVSIDKRLLKSFQLWLAIGFSIGITLLIFVIGDLSLISLTIENVLNQTLLILPNILGFTLAAYVLLIGFSNSQYMENITDLNDKGYSYFQHIGCLFAWCCIIQSLTLCTLYIINIVYKMQIEFSNALFINVPVLIIILFGTLYSLFLIVRLILNTFLFAQTVQFHFTLDKIEKEYKLLEEKSMDKSKPKKGIIRQIIELIIYGNKN